MQIALIEFLKRRWSWRWVFLTVAVLILASTAVYAWMRPDLYRSETRILVESASVLDDPLSPSFRDRTEERANAIRQSLESRSILERIIEEFRLRSADTSVPMDDALIALGRNLIVSKPLGNTFIISYLAYDPQAAQAIARRLAEIVIQTSQTLQKDRAIDKDQFMEQELRQAELQLSVVDDKIKDFKAQHLGELPEQGAANVSALNGLHSQLIAIDTTLDRARDQQKLLQFRLEEQSKLNELAKSIPSKEKPALVDIRGNATPTMLAMQLQTKRAQLAEMTARYMAKHPDAVRLTKEVEDLEKAVAVQDAAQPAAGNIAQLTPLGPSGGKAASEAASDTATTRANMAAEADIAQVKYELTTLGEQIAKREKEREALLKNIGAYQIRLNLAPLLEQELLTLTREHEAIRQQVANLQNGKFNAQMAVNALSSMHNDIYRILDEASLPERPISPTRAHILLMGIVAALVVALPAAFIQKKASRNSA